MTTMKSLGQPDVPKPMQYVAIDLFARGMSYDRIAVTILEKHEIELDPDEIRKLIRLYPHRVRDHKAKIKRETPITAASLEGKLRMLLDKRVTRALEDFDTLRHLATRRAEEEITEEEYKRRKSTLYLPAYMEVSAMLTAVTKKAIRRTAENTDEPEEKTEEESYEELERKRMIAEAIESGDPIKINAAMYGNDTPQEASRAQLQERAPAPAGELPLK